jgi:phage tail sheath protein FI
MPEYLSPGVYVEEISTGPRPIEGVSTSTAGFVGEAERGPTKPRLVTSWQDYVRWFGGYVDRPSVSVTETNNIFLAYAARGFFENGGQRLFVARVTGPDPAKATLSLDGGNLQLEAVGPGPWGNQLWVRVSLASAADALPDDSTSPVKQWFRVRIVYYRDGLPTPFVDPTKPENLGNPDRKEPDAFEDWDNLSHDSTQLNYAMSVINPASTLVQVLGCTAPPAAVELPDAKLDDGQTAAATRDDYLDADTVNPEERKGVAGLSLIKEISLISIPDDVVLNDLGNDLVTNCESSKDRFAILNVTGGQSNVADIRPVRDTSYAAVYYPWIRVLASHTPEGHRLVPPSGHVGGIYARVDVERGVHKAPANEVVRGIVVRDLNGTKKPLEFTLSKREHDILNPRGVNVIRDFRTELRDIRVWGARTMSSDSMWKYINVRRLFIFLEQSIDRGTQWAVFEPNSEPTWIAIRTAITSFLLTVWRNGALAGTTQSEAFFVRCDRTTMTQDDFDNGRLICLVGVAPVKPAEFVIIRFSQKTLEAEA